jgi:F-type H+-transporting ATPase subunit b
MKLSLFFLSTLLITTEAFAASKGTGTLVDLTYPTINFILLFGTLGIMLRKPVKAMFDKNAEDVTSLFGLAEEKNKEAQIRLDEYNKKMANLDSEKNKILKEAEQNANSFSKEHATETDGLIASLHSDAKNRIESEKIQMGRNLNS